MPGLTGGAGDPEVLELVPRNQWSYEQLLVPGGGPAGYRGQVDAS